jgi:outer membrane protein
VRKAPALVMLWLGVASLQTAAQEPPTTPVANSTKQSSASPAKQVTITQAEAIALQNNPQITVGKLIALQAHESVRETRSAYYPTVELNVTGVTSDPGSRIAAGALTNPTVYPRAAGGAQVSQLVTDFGRTPNLVSSAEYQAKAQEQNAVATKQQIILAVDQAFYNVLETKALQHVAEETLKTRELFASQIQALTNSKIKSDLDLSFANVDASQAKLLLLEAQNNYSASLSTLSAILGYRELQDFELVEAPASDAAPAPDVTPLIQEALQQRPEVRALEEEVTAAAKFSRAEHDLWWPTVSASGVVGQAPVRDDHIPSWYGAVGVNINIPLFNGFLFNARAKSADLQTQLRQKQLQDLQDNVARDVRNGWLGTQRAYERLSVTRQLREQASLALSLAQSRYQLGLSSIVEFSQAELAKTDAELQDTDAHYQYALSQIALAYQIGTSR